MEELDLEEVETRLKKEVAYGGYLDELPYQLIYSDMPALIARVGELQEQVGELEAQIESNRQVIKDCTTSCVEFCELAKKEYQHVNADWLKRAELENRVRELETKAEELRRENTHLRVIMVDAFIDYALEIVRRDIKEE